MSGAGPALDRAGRLQRPLRLAQVGAFPFPSPQGSQVFVHGMAKALLARGHAVEVHCYGYGFGEAAPGLELRRCATPVGYRRLRAGPDLMKPALNISLAAGVWRAARDGLDLLHAHNYEAPLACLPARARFGLPLIYCAHNRMGDELETYFSGRGAQAAARLSGAALDHTVPRLADHAMAIHPRSVAGLRALGCRSVSCVEPGVDPAELPPTAPALLPPGPWVVYAGNPDRYQDLPVLFAAMRRVPEARLLLVSASDMREWTALLPPRTLVIQTSDFAVVRAHLAAAELAVLPRAVCAGYPIKLLNYLGMGLPTVMAAGAAVAAPGVEPAADGDEADFARAIRRLLAEPARRRAMGAAARAHVLERCSWAARAAELEAVYVQCLADAAPAPRAADAGAAGQPPRL